jgi:hypothetical protein
VEQNIGYLMVTAMAKQDNEQKLSHLGQHEFRLETSGNCIPFHISQALLANKR